MKVVVDEKLGAWVSYGKDEVRVVKSLYDKVPQELKQDFEAVLTSSCNKYHNSVNEAKSKGEKPKAMYLKKLAIDDVKKWVSRNGILSTDEKVIVSKEPRIPSNNEVTRVEQKKSYLVEMGTTQEEIASMFNNFDSDSLSDERVEVQETSESIDLEDDLFEGIDLLDGLEDF